MPLLLFPPSTPPSTPGTVGTAPAGLMQGFCEAGAPVLGTRLVFYPVASIHISQACPATLTATDLELSSDSPSPSLKLPKFGSLIIYITLTLQESMINHGNHIVSYILEQEKQRLACELVIGPQELERSFLLSISLPVSGSIRLYTVCTHDFIPRAIGILGGPGGSVFDTGRIAFLQAKAMVVH